MAMSTGGGSGGGTGQVMAEINVTPLVDVMLVLLIIFMITAPLMAHKVQIELPKAVAKPNTEPPQTVVLSVKSTGEIYWNDLPIMRSAVDAQLRVHALRVPQPEFQIRADGSTEYGVLADMMATAKAAGMKKIGFITTPQGAN
jgi:biopolymer transport protein ExbD